MRLPALLALLGLSMTLHANDLPLARLFADPPLSGPTPRVLKVSPDASRVTFLRGRPDDQNRLDLWEYRIRGGQTRRLVDADWLGPREETLSDAEKARRERARIAAFSGIVDYQFAPDGRSILFPLNGALYLYDLRGDGREAVRAVTRAEEGFATDPKVSPRGRYVSFVRDGALWAVEVATGRARRLSPAAEGTVSWAMAEFVAQEEMDRLTGYWWAPDDSAVAFTRVDEAPVTLARRFEISADRTAVIEQRYPAAGEPNVEIGLFVARLDAGEDATNPPPRAIDLGPEKDIYLARVHWVDSGRLTFQRQSRDQRRLDLVLHDLGDDTQRVLVSETSPTWVNLHDDLRFLPGGRFLWSSERSGRKQLYLYAFDGSLVRQASDTPWAVENVLAVDAERGLVYVHAAGPDALEKHVWAQPLRGGEPKRLSAEAGWHEAVFAGNAQVFGATHSAPDAPPRVRLFDRTGRERAVLEANTLDAAHPYAPFSGGHVLPEFGTLAAADGQTLHYALFKPPGFDPARRYPAIVRYYGGPGRQFVRRDWTAGVNTGITDLLSQYWARQGYVVFAIDNRGTPRRGKVFEDPLYRKMGTVDVADQKVGIAWLAAQPWIDRARIGAFGWSYGGYLTLMLLAKAPDLVHAGAAVAPVSDWALYDTHYTERYMDHPRANVDGYREGNVLTYADAIRGRLLLVHGMADDNVLFTHTTALMAPLQARAFPFELMTYPGGKHGLVGTPIRTHVYEAIDRFFARELRPKGAD
ncbi:MAG: DPP IV N-terminal domain-containing protein [Pseudomonadota bacterium]